MQSHPLGRKVLLFCPMPSRCQVDGQGIKTLVGKGAAAHLQTAVACVNPRAENTSGDWTLDAGAKSKHLANVCAGKYTLPDATEDIADGLVAGDCTQHELPQIPPVQEVARVLLDLRVRSATGPDAISARLLRECAADLSPALRHLLECILSHGAWPRSWREHWVVPIHKRGSVFDARN